MNDLGNNSVKRIVTERSRHVFGGHIWELAIVLALALVVFGPKRLPEIGGAMGKGIKEFKKGTSEPAELADTRPAPEATSAAPGQVKIVSQAETPATEPRRSEVEVPSAGPHSSAD
ncbi:MAG TPA: twin-arginine translocase TatA/TatE family subunit [Chloroflexota bacterium]